VALGFACLAGDDRKGSSSFFIGEKLNVLLVLLHICHQICSAIFSSRFLPPSFGPFIEIAEIKQGAKVEVALEHNSMLCRATVAFFSCCRVCVCVSEQRWY